MSTLATTLYPSSNAPSMKAAALNELLPTTVFVEAFKNEFLEPSGIWPPPGSDHQDIATDFGMFMEVLLVMQRFSTPPPTPSGNALRDRVIQFVVAQQWSIPGAGTPLPAEWQHDKQNGELTEIWLICRELLNAVHVFGSGGQPAQIPPH